MKRPLAALVVLALSSIVVAQEPSPAERGQKLRDQLARAELETSLVGEARLSGHLGVARAGFLVLKTEVGEASGQKVYRLEDRLDVDAPGLGAVKLLLQAELARDLSIVSLSLESESPDAAGALSRRRLDLVVEDGKLIATEVRGEQKPVRRVLEASPRCVPLTPPVGAGERLARLGVLSKARGELSVPALDLETLEVTTLKLEVPDVSPVEIRGSTVNAVSTRRREASAELVEAIASAEPLLITRSDRVGRLSFVGREPREGAAELPQGAADSPAATVLKALRASGRGDRAALEQTLDLDALWARASKGTTDPALEKTWRKVLLDKLTSDEWRRGGAIALIAGASSVEDLEEKRDGDRAVVMPRAGTEPRPRFELSKSAAGWKIVALPEGR